MDDNTDILGVLEQNAELKYFLRYALREGVPSADAKEMATLYSRLYSILYDGDDPITATQPEPEAVESLIVRLNILEEKHGLGDYDLALCGEPDSMSYAAAATSIDNMLTDNLPDFIYIVGKMGSGKSHVVNSLVCQGLVEKFSLGIIDDGDALSTGCSMIVAEADTNLDSEPGISKLGIYISNPLEVWTGRYIAERLSDGHFFDQHPMYPELVQKAHRSFDFQKPYADLVIMNDYSSPRT
ncbi:MAG: hypothetical protein ABIC95_02275 [archaeon]